MVLIFAMLGLGTLRATEKVKALRSGARIRDWLAIAALMLNAIATRS